MAAFSLARWIAPRYLEQGRILARRLARFGIERYPPEVQRRLSILNVVSYLIAFFTLIYAVQHVFIDFERYWPVILINLALVVVALSVPFVHRFHEMAGGFLLAGAEFVALLVLTAYLGRNSGVHIQYIVAAAAPFVIWGLNRLVWVVGLVVTGLALHLYAWFRFPQSTALIDAEASVIDAVYVSAAITTVSLIAATVYYAFRLAERAQAETDALLRNVLPESIAERLKAKPGETISDSFPEATVLFADLVGFTPLAQRLGAPRTVELLNDLVSELDRLAARHGVEKIKTIGDSFMAVSGVPAQCHDHCLRMARMAAEVHRAVERLAARHGLDLSMRIGMACGPIMAGVIGQRRFIYDVWGDTVNLASRLEQSGMPGRTHVSGRVRDALDGIHPCERRGVIDIKGMGQLETWFLTDPPAAKLDQGQAAVVPLHDHRRRSS